MDPGSHPAHCGGCDSPCDGSCEAGVCVLECGEGERECNGACVDTSSDDANCGECGNACGEDGQCVDSACVCSGDTALCEGSCVDYSSDPDHCGACGDACVAGPNVESVGCEESSCVLSCADGFDDCDGDFSNGCETDLSAPESCGACGTSCREDQTCTAEGCGCPEGFEECGGVCVDTDSNADHCGSCDISCDGRTNSTGGVCEEGSCVLACAADFDDCNDSFLDGCETPTDADEQNCGGCGISCGSEQSCMEGACACADGLTACGEACVDTLSDLQNCGGCGVSCDGTCQGGLCCGAGLTACGDQCVALDSDPDNCSGCGLSCADFANTASGTCEDSVCTEIVCEENFGNCNGDIADGCEVSLLTDFANCGACGNDECAYGCANGDCSEIEALRGKVDTSCVILSGDGSVKCWGSNREGQVGNGSVGGNVLIPEYVVDPQDPSGRLTGVVQLGTGINHSCARLSDGTVKCWGQMMEMDGEEITTISTGEPTYVPDPSHPSGRLSDVADLITARLYNCAVLTDTTVKCWGMVPDGTTMGTAMPVPMTILASADPPDPIKGIRHLALGNFHACGVTTTGEVLCLGHNANGQLGDGTTESSIFPVRVGGATPLANVEALGLGQDHSCALHTNGTVSCWGRNHQLQLGVPSTGDGGISGSSLPVTVSDLVGAKTISTGVSHNCVLLDDSTAKCWGTGSSRRLGNGATAHSLPAFVKDGTNNTENLTGITFIEAANAHSCALLNSGVLQCVGRNNAGQLGNASTTAANWMAPVIWK